MKCSPLSRYLAELIGTLILVLMGCGSAVLAGSDIGFVGVSLTFGLTLLLLAYAIGPISGCHVNPAVTLCLFFDGKIAASEAPGYIISQLIGGVIGAWILYLIASGIPGFDISKGFALNGFGEHSPHQFSMISCLITEITMTSLLLFVVLATTKSYFSSGFGGLTVGLTLAAIHLVSIPVTNTSVNFARSFGPAVFHGGWALEQLWLFAIAQFIAVIVALGLHKITCQDKN